MKGMESPLVSLVAASIAFAGSHFALSHPLRAPLVRALGEKGFLAVYSLIAFAALGWMVWAFHAAPAGPMLWNGTADAPWIAASVLTIAALALFLGSLRGNPALPDQSFAGLADKQPAGAFRVTRHPMMWGFALWALAHMLAAPSPRTLVLSAAILVLALLGAHLQDRKKEALIGESWRAWEGRTTYWPRLSQLHAPGVLWLAALVVWLGVTWLHMPLGGVPAGPWKWIAAN
jgi:uncharacterized membrane protein